MLHKRLVFCVGAGLLLSGVAVTFVAAQQVTIKETPPGVAAGRQPAVTAADPAAAKVHYKRAYALLGVGQTDASILEFQQAIHLDMPDPAGAAHNPVQTADAYRNLGEIRQAKNQLISAAANYRASLRLAPNNALTHAYLGDALCVRGLEAEAVPEYRTALRLDPAGQTVNLASVHENLGSCYAHLKQYETAVAEYRAVVRLMPNDYQTHYNLGLTLDEMHRYSDSIREHREALRLRPGYAPARNGLGCSLFNSGDREAGRVEWRKVLRMGDADAADEAREHLADTSDVTIIYH